MLRRISQIPFLCAFKDFRVLFNFSVRSSKYDLDAGSGETWNQIYKVWFKFTLCLWIFEHHISYDAVLFNNKYILSIYDLSFFILALKHCEKKMVGVKDDLF